jgi:pyrroline-5-carboxylate reductase
VYAWGIVGAGNIGTALIGGLNTIGQRPYVYDRNSEKLTDLNEVADFSVGSSATDVIESSRVVLLCVRTSQIDGFLERYLDIAPRTYVLFQAGFSLSNLTASEEGKKSFLRAITNINIMSGDGYTVLLRDDNNPDYAVVKELLGDVGVVLEVDTEEKLELYSLPSGCGPAPVLAFYDSLKEEAMRMGLDERLAANVAANVITGTVKAMQAYRLSPTELAKRVGTQGGVVERAIQDMEGRRGYGEELSQYFDGIRRA